MILLFPKKGKPKAAGAMDYQQTSFNMEEEDEDLDAEKDEEELNNEVDKEEEEE